MERTVMTHQGAVIFTDVTGELVDGAIVQHYYPDVSAIGSTLVWATWRKPTHAELVRAWPARWPPDRGDRARGWWEPTLDELRGERRKARSVVRAQETRRSGKTES
jgi:hypothetical protein